VNKSLDDRSASLTLIGDGPTYEITLTAEEAKRLAYTLFDGRWVRPRQTPLATARAQPQIPGSGRTRPTRCSQTLPSPSPSRMNW